MDLELKCGGSSSEPTVASLFLRENRVKGKKRMRGRGARKTVSTWRRSRSGELIF
jgi:hypothetical protein